MRWKLPASHDRACKNDKTLVLQSPLKDGFKGKARKVLVLERRRTPLDVWQKEGTLEPKIMPKKSNALSLKTI